MTDEEKLSILYQELTAQGNIEALKALAQCSGTNLGLASKETEEWLTKFITQDKDMLGVKEDIRLLSRVDDPVIIYGDTGTGKNLLANALHGNRKGLFVHINCAGLPRELVESELFGYEKGAFTGANYDRDGLFLAAKDGTLFLDEIGDLCLEAQAKLLVVIQERKVRRVGGKDYKPITCRIVCATHHNLKQEITQSKFRQDLYERLSTFEVYVKSLKDRGLEEIELIANSIFNGRDTKGKFLPKDISEQIVNEWSNGAFSGNVREIQKLVRRYEVLKLKRF